MNDHVLENEPPNVPTLRQTKHKSVKIQLNIFPESDINIVICLQATDQQDFTFSLNKIKTLIFSGFLLLLSFKYKNNLNNQLKESLDKNFIKIRYSITI